MTTCPDVRCVNAGCFGGGRIRVLHLPGRRKQRRDEGINRVFFPTDLISVYPTYAIEQNRVSLVIGEANKIFLLHPQGSSLSSIFSDAARKLVVAR